MGYLILYAISCLLLFGRNEGKNGLKRSWKIKNISTIAKKKKQADLWKQVVE